MLNASSLSTKRIASSTNDTRVVHPYVVQKRQQDPDDKSPWQTAIITRTRDKQYGNIIVKIKKIIK